MIWMGLIGIALFGALPYLAMNPNDITGIYTTLIGIVFITACYVLGRTGYYTAAAWGTFAIITLTTFALGISTAENAYLTLIYLLIPILVSGILFSTLTMLMISGLFIFAMALLPIVFDHIIFENLLAGPMSLVMSLSIMLFIGTHFGHWRIKQTSQKHASPPDHLWHMIELSSDMIAIHRNGRLVYINQAGVDLLGADSSRQLINRDMYDFLQQNSRRTLPAQIVRFDVSDQYVITTSEKLTRLDGEMIDVEVTTDQIIYEGAPATQIIVHTLNKTTPIADRIQQQFLEFTDDLILVHQNNGHITYANEVSVQTTGYTPQELIGRQIAEVIPAYYETALQPHITDTGSFSPDIVHTTMRSNGRRPVRIQTRPLHPDHVDSDRMVIVRDATEHEIDKQALDQANRRFEKIMRSGTVAVALISNEDYHFVDVNDVFCDLLNYERSQLINTNIDDINLWVSDDFKTLVKQMNAGESIRDHNTILSDKHGEMHHIRVSLELVELGNEPCTMFMATDISRYLEATRLMGERENRYRIVSELMSDYAYGWLVEDGEVSLDWITGAFERITGYRVEEARQWQEWMIIHPEDSVSYQHMLRILKKGKAQTLDYRMITKSGATRWVRDYARPILNNEKVVGIYGAIRDRTDQVLSEDSRRIHALEQAVVAEIGRKALLKDVTLDILLDETLPLLTQVLNVQYCSVYALSEDQKHLNLQSAVGWQNPVEEVIQLNDDNIYTQASYTLLTKEPVTVSNMHTEQRFTPGQLITNSDIISGLTVLIHGQSDVLGVLGIYSQDNYAFTLADINFLQSIANTLAAYMEQQKTARQERDQRRLAEALRDTAEVLNSTLQFDAVIDRMMAHLSRVLPYDAATLMLIEGQYAEIVKFVEYGDFQIPGNVQLNNPLLINDLPLVQHMAEHSEPLVLAHTQKDARWRVFAPEGRWIQSYVGAPILFQGELIGILNVDSATPNRFTDDDASRLMAFANQASIAIHNARYAQELKEQVEKRTEQLNIEHRRLESVLKATGEGIFYTEDTMILFVNDRICEMLGYAPQELIGRRTTILVGREWDEQAQMLWEEARETLINTEVQHAEHQLTRKDGTKFDAALTISAATAPESHNDELMTVTIVRDISQQKALEKQRERFISSASHELRSPITSINTRLYLMRNKPEEMGKHIELMERVVERMNTLIEDLLDRDRLERNTLPLRNRNVVLQNVVEKITEVMKDDAEREAIALTTTSIDDPLRVFIDTDRMSQVITNIINNAINYTDPDGLIMVEVTQGFMEDDDETMYAKIIVSDNGAGISAAHLPYIFDEFFRGNKHVQGNGLGLNIAREIVRLHGGDITVESTVNVGSIFTIWLPTKEDTLV